MELEVLEGPEAGGRIVLPPMLLVGRGGNCDLVLQDPSLSALHCRFRITDDGVVVTDLGSTNGTFVNDMSILQCRLKHGDRIRVGLTLLEYHSDVGRHSYPETDFSDTGLQGEVFGQIGYTLNRKIADGGMGSVYEAVQYGAEGFEKRVAIKTILPDLSEKDDFVTAFVGEARLAADLVHPNIVQIYHLGRYAGGYYIAMEYVDGIALQDFCDLHKALGIRVPVVWAVYLTSSVARALDYAYCHLDRDGEPMELVHRDVSPNNIMIDLDGGVKLTDFGVARISRESAKHDQELVGCVEFMSPEQAACLPLDGRSDQFALGLVFYELLTGVRVFRSAPEKIDETLEEIKAAVIPPPQNYVHDLAGDVCAMVSKMLNKDVQDRYRDAGMVADGCDAYLRLCGCLLTAADLAAYVDDIVWRYTHRIGEDDDR